MLFFNGKILTMNPYLPEGDYLKITDDKITEVGIDKFTAKEGKMIDLKGRTLLPGFCDTHLHLLSYGVFLKAVNLHQCTSVEEMLKKVKERVDEEIPGNWILGRGWDENRFGGKLPGRDDLDRVSPDNPIILSRVCGHLIVVNSKALEILGIENNIPDVSGGSIDRDERGRLTGIFRERAMEIIYNRIPKKSKKEVEDALVTAGKSLLSYGITTVHTDDLGEFANIKPIIELYRKLYLEKKIPKTHLHIRVDHLDEAKESGYKTGYQVDGITIGAVKIFADGSLGAKTAALLDDYSDKPGEKGILCYTDTELFQMVKKAHDADFAVAIHGIGDAAAYQAVKVIGRVQSESPKPYLRHRLIHAQILNHNIMEDMIKYNIIAEIQPIFINTDLHWAEKRVGERIRTSYNWKTMWEKGIKLSGSSDCPVEPVNPLWGIYSAVTRKDLKGYPAEGWYTTEALSVNQALQLFTTCGAYTGREEGQKGTLEVGKAADLVLIDRPVDEVLPEEIKDIKVKMTVLDGEIVYISE